MPDDDLYEILGLLLAANEHAGRDQTFATLVSGFNEYAFAGVSGWPEARGAPSEHTVDEMEELGWIRTSVRKGKSRSFAVTRRGREAWSEREAQMSQVGAGAVSLGWPSAKPVLQQIFDIYQEDGAPDLGVWVPTLAEQASDPVAFNAMIRELVRSGWLDVGWGGVADPRHVRPSPKAMELLAGWPASAAEDTLAGLVAELDTAIERTADPERRSKLITVRDGLVGAARDVAIAYLEKKIGAA